MSPSLGSSGYTALENKRKQQNFKQLPRVNNNNKKKSEQKHNLLDGNRFADSTQKVPITCVSGQRSSQPTPMDNPEIIQQITFGTHLTYPLLSKLLHVGRAEGSETSSLPESESKRLTRGTYVTCWVVRSGVGINIFSDFSKELQTVGLQGRGILSVSRRHGSTCFLHIP